MTPPRAPGLFAFAGAIPEQLLRNSRSGYSRCILSSMASTHSSPQGQPVGDMESAFRSMTSGLRQNHYPQRVEARRVVDTPHGRNCSCHTCSPWSVVAGGLRSGS